ncbi:MAG: hypothetical protein LBP87_12245, partial [Planctomycetaceae bacterium]|nr:hypothetical protein [Planctomycetaceae bacterium]
YFDSEKAIRTSHPKLRCAAHRRFDWNIVNEQIHELLLMKDSPVAEVREMLQKIVEEYQPECGTKTIQFRVLPKTDELRKTG